MVEDKSNDSTTAHNEPSDVFFEYKQNMTKLNWACSKSWVDGLSGFPESARGGSSSDSTSSKEGHASKAGAGSIGVAGMTGIMVSKTNEHQRIPVSCSMCQELSDDVGVSVGSITPSGAT